MRELIDPRVDLAFKKIFGVEENKDLLISLINSVVSDEDQVQDVKLLNPYNPKTFRMDKLSILDIKAVGMDGKRFNIEIQISDEADYDKRALYYWGKLYTEQLQTGQDYGLLCKAIGIHILNFMSIPDSKKYHNVFNIREKEDNIGFFKDLELHTIELSKFNADERFTQVKTALDRWVAFLTRQALINRENLPDPMNQPDLKKALNVLDVMNLTTEERNSYEDHLKWLRIEANTLKKYKKDGYVEGLEEGIQKGLEEGIQKGLEEGIQKGLEEGIQKGLEEGKMNMAKAMLKERADEGFIMRLTGLSQEEIETLKKI
jgi:predicted transposase/invertase (TIGR01784 family)